MSEVVKENSVVGLLYSLYNSEGALLEKRGAEEPLLYIQGHETILPKIEDALEGRAVGFEVTLHLKAIEAYGEYDEELVAKVDRGQFPKDLNVEAGMRFDTTGPNGEPVIVEVIEIDTDSVTVDGNHPLAGEDLTFKLKIHSLRAATKEEIAHGHVHGAGSHHHH